MAENPGERSVLAYFQSGDSAGGAAGELRAAGYQTVRVGRISHYGGESSYPAGGELTGMTIFSSVNEDSAYGEPESYLVTVVTDEGSAGQVKEIVERYGGNI